MTIHTFPLGLVAGDCDDHSIMIILLFTLDVIRPVFQTIFNKQ